MPEIAYINGEFLPLERAMVHVEDRGFQFADAVYEVLRTYGGKPFAVADHIARLFRSLDAIEMKHNFSRESFQALIDDAVKRAGFPEAVVYIQISRGRAPRRRDFPSSAAPTLVMTVRALEPMASATRERGVKVVTTPDLRWARCDIKSVGLLANILAYNAARAAGAHDAIFVEADGTVTEATAGNIFVVSRGTLRTPPKGPKLLSGVTRDKILQAACAANVPCAEERITKSDLYAAEEIFLTSTTVEALSVVAVDGHVIGDGQPGPVTACVHEQFLKMFATG